MRSRRRYKSKTKSKHAPSHHTRHTRGNTRRSPHKRKPKDPYAHTSLYPPLRALRHYKMKVSAIHTVAFSTYGNPNGKPVLFVHGGPGGGTTPHMARFFSPIAYYIVLVDQRGCGKSTPTAELRENTTSHLIQDFEKIRCFLNIQKWMVFGGSWGSTLSLAYAIAHPNRTTELVLRGIFTGSKAEVDWIAEPEGAQFFRQDGWNYYQSAIPPKHRTNYMDAYGKCFKGKFGEKTKDECLLAWSTWEASLSKLHQPSLESVIRDYKRDRTYVASSLIEHHYFKNGCFMEEGYLLKRENLDKIRHIPTVIVQGQYDLVCPFMTAYKLHQALPHAKFVPTMAGHTAFDEENIRHLVEATNSFL